MLSLAQVKDVCSGSSWDDTCKYLTSEYDVTAGKFISLCLKLSPGLVQTRIKNGLIQKSVFDKRPDHCKGYSYLKSVLQGYDVK